jgi:DNA-binding LytR/AlgR family response regulator
MNILIVEDEAPAARRLERMTRELVANDIGSLTIAASIAEAERYLADNAADLVLLDLNLNGSSGFDLLSRITAGSFHTIVVSASIDRALAAFEYGVLDFVPKPVDRQRLAKALKRLNSVRSSDAPEMKFLSVTNRGTVRLVPLQTVRFFKAADDYVELHLADGSVELSGKSLDSLCRILPQSYCRIHRSYVVNVADARQIRVFGGGRYELELRNGTSLPISRTQYPVIRKMLEI